jgi:hypothetical protein
MKCLCVKRCQARDNDGYIRTFAKGDVWDFKETPPNFVPIEGEDAVPINFDTAQEQELLESDFNLDDLKEYILKKYGKKAGNRGKDKTIEYLLDCRFRELSDADLNPTTDVDEVL